jgi:methylenetetrahydrofolate dehydrogenase (NADP+) / methenyltetrahydrofolate cyclohydrolase
MQILDGKLVSEELSISLKERVDVLKEKGVTPKLVFFLIGDSSASKAYVYMKQKFCGQMGIESEVVRYEEEVEQETVLEKIREMNEDDSVHGMMVQLRVPDRLDEREILQSIAVEKDVDGLCDENQEDPTGEGRFAAATPRGVKLLLDYYGLSLSGKRVVILGRTNLFGIPFRKIVESAGASEVGFYGRNWVDHEAEIAEADFVVSALGGGRILITPEMVKDNVICIDVGLGPDFDFEAFMGSDKEGWITPAKGGTGPMTVYAIVENCVLAAERSLDSS